MPNNYISHPKIWYYRKFKDRIERNSQIKLKLHLSLFYPSTWYTFDFFLFHIEIEGKGGWIIGGGGQRVCCPPPLKLLGGGGWPPLAPPLRTPMAFFSVSSLSLFVGEYFEEKRSDLISLNDGHWVKMLAQTFRHRSTALGIVDPFTLYILKCPS